MRTSSGNNGSAGFTLVEVMTALFVVGLAAGAVMLMAPGSESRLRDAALRLAARIQAASDTSVLVNRKIGLVVTSEGYGFQQQEEDGWREISSDAALSFRAWPAGVAPRIEPASQTGPQEKAAPVAEFDPLGGRTPVRLVLDDGDGAWAVTIDEAGGVRAARSR